MPIISDFFYITGVDDRELITYNPDTISLDANNIQTTPVLFTIISGAEVYFSVRIETALGEDVTIWEEINVPTPYNSYSFVHPADKYGLSNQVTVIAYSDSERKNKLGQRTVSIIRAEAEPNPRPEKEWNASMIFNNGDMILLGDVIYMWSNPVPGNSKIPPKDDIQQNPLTTSWKAYPEMIVMGTRFLLARKINADQIDVDSIFAGTIQANDATINNFNATNVRIQSGYIGGFEIANGRIGQVDANRGYGPSITDSHIGICIQGDNAGGIIRAGFGSYQSALATYRGEGLSVCQQIAPESYHSTSAATVSIEVHGGSEPPPFNGEPVAGNRQTALRIITDEAERDVALALVGKIQLHDKNHPFREIFGQTMSVGFRDVWNPSNNRYNMADLFFINGILVDIKYH